MASSTSSGSLFGATPPPPSNLVRHASVGIEPPQEFSLRTNIWPPPTAFVDIDAAEPLKLNNGGERFIAVVWCLQAGEPKSAKTDTLQREILGHLGFEDHNPDYREKVVEFPQGPIQHVRIGGVLAVKGLKFNEAPAPGKQRLAFIFDKVHLMQEPAPNRSWTLHIAIVENRRHPDGLARINILLETLAVIQAGRIRHSPTAFAQPLDPEQLRMLQSLGFGIDSNEPTSITSDPRLP